MLQLTIVGNISISRLQCFEDLLKTIILTFLKNDNIVFDKSSFTKLPPDFNFDDLSRNDAWILFKKGLKLKRSHLDLWSKNYLEGTPFSESLTLYRDPKHNRITLFAKFDQSLLDYNVLDDFVNNIPSSELAFMCIEDVKYSLKSRLEWERSYIPSDLNAFKKGNEELREKSPYVVLLPFARVPWTASIYWFGDMFFSIIPKGKLESFDYTVKTKNLSNGVLSVRLHNNDIVLSDKTNTEKRVQFRRHLNIK